MSANLTEVENALVGMSAGVIEVLALQPLNYMKNMRQQKLAISFSPSIMYRGVGANCFNMGGCTMVQFSVGGMLKSKFQDSNGKLSAMTEMGCGIGAGVTSAFIGTPLELVMIQQQRKGHSTVAALKSVMNANILRGFAGCAVREGLWTCGYLSIPPIIRRQLKTNFPDTFDTDAKARVPASLLGGLFACYLTHPFDTIKTCMQGDIERKTYGTFSETAKAIHSEAGIRGFYSGATFRYGRMVCAVAMLDSLQGLLGPLMFPDKF